MTGDNSSLTQPYHVRAYFKVAFLITALSCPVQVAVIMLWWETGFWWAMALPFLVYPFSLYFFLCSNFGKPAFIRKLMAMTLGFLCGYMATYGLLFGLLFKLAIDAMD